MIAATPASESLVVGRSARMRAVFEFLRVIGNSESTVLITGESGTGKERDLKQMVAEGKFREDLYYRLNVLPVALPPLRERREDIPVLMDHSLERYFRRRGEDPPQISEAVRQAFMRYSWPGNVRELENACERIAQTCTCGTVRVGCMSASILFRAGAQPADVAPPMLPQSQQ